MDMTLDELALAAEACRQHVRRLRDAGDACQHSAERAQMFYAKADAVRRLGERFELTQHASQHRERVGDRA